MSDALDRLGARMSKPRRPRPNRPPPRKQVTASLADRPRGRGRASRPTQGMNKAMQGFGRSLGMMAGRAANARPNPNRRPMGSDFSKRSQQSLNRGAQLMGAMRGARQMFNEGGMAELDTPIDELPNPGLKELAKTEKGRKAVKRMGFDHGGLVKGQPCPHREDGVRGTGIAVKGGKFSGVF